MHTERTRIPTYTDGTEVKEGDRIRYRQTPGGLLPASPEWTEGIAAKYPHTKEERERMDAFNLSQGYIALDPDELFLQTQKPNGYGTRTSYFYIYSHIIERIEGV